MASSVPPVENLDSNCEPYERVETPKLSAAEFGTHATKKSLEAAEE